MTQSYSITTVVVAATSSYLTDVATVKDELEINDKSKDAYLTRQIKFASAAVANYCNRVFGQQTYQDLIQLERAYRYGDFIRGANSPILVSAFPLSSITSVTETSADGTITTLVVDVDYRADLTTGELWRLDSLQQARDWSTAKITIIYVAGWTLPDARGYTLPPDVEDATIRLVKKAYFARKRDPLVRQESVPEVGEFQYWVSGSGDGNMPTDVTDLLDNYRVPVVGGA